TPVSIVAHPTAVTVGATSVPGSVVPHQRPRAASPLSVEGDSCRAVSSRTPSHPTIRTFGRGASSPRPPSATSVIWSVITDPPRAFRAGCMSLPSLLHDIVLVGPLTPRPPPPRVPPSADAVPGRGP